MRITNSYIINLFTGTVVGSVVVVVLLLIIGIIIFVFWAKIKRYVCKYLIKRFKITIDKLFNMNDAPK